MKMSASSPLWNGVVENPVNSGKAKCIQTA